MLRTRPLRRTTNAKDVSHYLNKLTGEHEVHVGLDRGHISNRDLRFLYTEPDTEPATLFPGMNESKNDQQAPFNNAESEQELTELDDTLPDPASSPVLRRSVGFDVDKPVEHRLMINPKNELVDATGLDLKHSTNEDLKPASPNDKTNFSMFSHNNPHIRPLEKVSSFIEAHKRNL